MAFCLSHIRRAPLASLIGIAALVGLIGARLATMYSPIIAASAIALSIEVLSVIFVSVFLVASNRRKRHRIIPCVLAVGCAAMGGPTIAWATQTFSSTGSLPWQLLPMICLPLLLLAARPRPEPLGLQRAT